jgi:prepilin-type N-terminal cleavage/methylation domain-containing protein
MITILKTYRSRLVARIRGFTLIETLVAISLLSIAIVAPMSLTSQSLSAAYYARDQITAFNLAQEGLEAVRAIRDGQILEISRTADASSIDLFGPIPVNQDFTIDSRISDPGQAMHVCPSTACPPLQTDGVLYGYDVDTSTWPLTNFTRTLLACYIQPSGACNATVSDEIRLAVTVEWPTNSRQERTFTIYENLYRWVNDGSASTL